MSAVFAANLVRIREKRGLSQGQLAELAGFSQAAVSLWESGRRLPRWEHLVGLLEALGVTPSVLMHEGRRGEG